MQYFSEKINFTYSNTYSKTIYFNTYILIIKKTSWNIFKDRGSVHNQYINISLISNLTHSIQWHIII